MADLADHEACDTRARKAIEIIDRSGDQANARALKALHADTRGWWTEEREDPDSDEDERPEPTVPALRAFLDETVLPFHAQRIVALRHRHLLRSQAFGMAVRGTDLDASAATRRPSTVSCSGSSTCFYSCRTGGGPSTPRPHNPFRKRGQAGRSMDWKSSSVVGQVEYRPEPKPPTLPPP
jgi:hypothetical protein